MRNVILILSIIFCLLFISTEIYAVGLGFHLTGGAIIHRGYNEDRYGSRIFIGAGFTIDSNVAMNNLFNYRMQIDYTSSAKKIGKFNHDTVNLQNSFGFGVVRLQNFRFWLGPHFQLFYDFTDKRFDENIGLAFGFNYNMNKIVTLTLDCGARAAPLEWNTNSGKKYAARIEPFVNLGILFRVKDEYSNEKIVTSPEQQ